MKRVQRKPDPDLLGGVGIAPEDELNENKDEYRAAKTYCSCRFILGMTIMIISVVVHLCLLPFLDLTLVAGSACLGIIVAMILAIFVLGERFNWKYDLPGLTFIVVGSITIVLNANKEQQNFTAEEAVALLLSARALVFTVVCLSLIAINSCMLRRFLVKLRKFEADAEDF